MPQPGSGKSLRIQSHGQLSQNTSGVVEVGGLSYGLLHASAQAHYSWGVLRQVSFPGVNIDIGHMRLLAWAKDHDSQRWVQHNRLRGQHLSALEHANPERFFNNPSQCNPTGTSSPTAGLPECPQGISAVKALALAGSQGQKIYTLTQKVYNDNPGIVASQLSAHSAATRAQVQQALDQGQEVSIHERPINVSGWRGAGFVVIDPSTGAGGYVIEGGSNGGVLTLLAAVVLLALFFFLIVSIAMATPLFVTALAGAAGVVAPVLLDFVGVPDILSLIVLRGILAFIVVAVIGGALPVFGVLGLIVQAISSVFILMNALKEK